MVKASSEVLDQQDYSFVLIRFFPDTKAKECTSLTDKIMRNARLSVSSLDTYFTVMVLSQDGIVFLLRSNILWINMLADVEKKLFINIVWSEHKTN